MSTVHDLRRYRRALAAAVLLGVLAGGVALAGSAAGGAPRSGSGLSVFGLANRCVALRSLATGRFLAVAGPSHYAAGARLPAAIGFEMRPTGLGTYLLFDRHSRFMIVRRGAIRSATVANRRAEFSPRLVRGAGRDVFALRSTAADRLLAVRTGTGIVGLSSAATKNTLFEIVPRSGCARFPEAGVDASVLRPGRRFEHGRIFGFVDDHVHITGNMRAGGDVISGEPYDPFGVAVALGRDEQVHGADGKLDLTGNLLRTGSPFGTHDTHGWPTFTGWPTFDSMTHQQAYYVWLERAWRAGMRMVVAQTADDGPLCRIEPRRAVASCSETRSIEAQIRTLKGLQDYVDAQSGGPGRGWLRLVYSPAQARRVMAAGKLAVLIGIEASDLLGCGEVRGRPQCTRAQIDRGLARYVRLGVRGMFVAHWVNNAFAGAALESGTKGVFINILNRFQTGSYFRTGRCPARSQGVEVHTLSPNLLRALAAFFPAAKSIAGDPMPDYPSGPQCNTRGLTALGRYLIRRMIADHLLIEVDHLNESARDEVLAIAAKARYPLVSSHNGTGGEWTPSELARLYRLGGFAAVTPDLAPALAKKILAMRTYRVRGRFFAVGLGSDTNGFSSLPGPRPGAARHPLHYPFTSYDGSVEFTRERTGTRSFDLGRDGVAHYGLVADLIADMQRTGAGRRALPLLFGSAEAYLETWQRAFAHR